MNLTSVMAEYDVSTSDVFKALGSENASDALRKLYLRWRDEGHGQKIAESRVTAVLDALIAEGREEEADVIRESLDLVVGWCSPSYWIFNPNRGADEP